MSSRFIVCHRAPATAPPDTPACADCTGAIVIDGPVEAGAVYICEACLPARMDRDEPDDVEIPIAEPKPAEVQPSDTPEAMSACRESSNPACGCAWCKVVNPIAKGIAGVLRQHQVSKAARVEAMIRVLGEAAIVSKGHGFWHRDAAWVTTIVGRRLSDVADQEASRFYEMAKPKIEAALRDAGVDINDILRDVPKEPLH